MRRAAAAALALAAMIAGGVLVLSARHSGPAAGGIVSYVRDGDTIELTNGGVVRLVQIDTPELAEDECYARRARALLRRLLPEGTHVRVVEDRALDRVDRYGRRLAYVFANGVNVNLVLVARGAAAVWFFHGDRGRYARALLAASRRARAERLGLWRRCPGTRLDPLAPVDTGGR